MVEPLPKPLERHGIYPCPICRHGQIVPMVLMETHACNFCRHIFTLDPERQTARLEDGAIAFRWQWTGTGWRSLHRPSSQVTVVGLVLAILLIILPPTLIGLAYALFPPLEAGVWRWFPLLWTGLTLAAHALLFGPVLMAILSPEREM
ncbi:hypothetical protein FFX45_09000 [Thermosynechococcus sp. CL-1]|uniref:hypothetical protein n=1 Tax=Thermosynechococcus sp. CL-1 TaxID=2583530 RepID=UPI00122E71F5|nr:hypothetical protein [Thermosynechococcus sp. CL-1]QEQ01498.1 hypothetical protein FFX45_09000 [Thermosynechococcus sp. CL-1]